MEKDLVRIAIAVLLVAALYDVLSPTVGGGKSGASVQVLTAASKGIGGTLARLTGQKPPAGF